MSSAFLVFDLIRRNASPERSVTPEVASIQNLMTVKKRSGLSSEKRVSRVPAAKTSPKPPGPTKKLFFPHPPTLQHHLYPHLSPLPPPPPLFTPSNILY